jgi:hypothetical protein
MSETENIRALRSEFSRSLMVMERIERYFLEFLDNRLPETPGTDEAMIVAQSITNYYTCLETLFLRISQHFENSLAADRWHQSLLDRMILEIPDFRPQVISEQTHIVLMEFLKFRHFTRYYFELNYDWDKLLFLIKKFKDIRTIVKEEIRNFDSFLRQL